MKIKIKNLDEINLASIKIIIEDAYLEGLHDGLGVKYKDEEKITSYICDHIHTEDFTDKINDEYKIAEDKYNFNKTLANKIFIPDSCLDDSDGNIEYYFIGEKPNDISIPASYVLEEIEDD